MARRVSDTLRLWFVIIQEPKAIRVVMFCYYMFCIAAGVGAIGDAPALYVPHAEAFAMLEAALFIVGGIVGAVAVFPGQWGLERTALLSVTFALLLRATILGLFDGANVSPWILLGQLTLLVYRYLSIRKADLAPISG